jgi:hypothetical protein
MVLQATGASYANFLPDANLMVRNSGQAALTASFVGAAMSLKRLVPYWSVNEIGVAHQLLFAVKIEAITGGGPVYTFSLEIDDNAAFTSATEVDSLVVSQAVQVFHLALSREAILYRDTAAAYVRLKATLAGVAEVGSIAFSSVANAADTVTINDGSGHTTVFTFQAAGNGATGAAVDVAVGATATDSAQNLKTAINANLNIVGVVVTGAAATITITHSGTGGSITKVDADNDYAVTNFTGGVAASLQFWSFVRGDKGAC